MVISDIKFGKHNVICYVQLYIDLLNGEDDKVLHHENNIDVILYLCSVKHKMCHLRYIYDR